MRFPWACGGLCWLTSASNYSPHLARVFRGLSWRWTGGGCSSLAWEQRPLNTAFPAVSTPPSFESARDVLGLLPPQCPASTLPDREHESEDGADFHCQWSLGWQAGQRPLPANEDAKRPWEFTG